MATLRDEELLHLFANYPRSKRTFIKAVDYEDHVSSEFLIKDGRGQEMRPGDYLAAFDRFVQENPAKVEAIRILLDLIRPHVPGGPLLEVGCGHGLLLDEARRRARRLGLPRLEGGGDSMEQSTAFHVCRGIFEQAGFTKVADTSAVSGGFPRVLMRHSLP